MNYQKEFRSILLFATVLSLVGIFAIHQASAKPIPALKAGPLSGWAWSSNIGWISFNSTNAGAGVGGTYGVNIDTSGNMTGYAWSSNIGWIKFGGLSGFPTGGSQAGNAYVGNTYSDRGKVTGWIRACAGTVNNAPNQNLPGDCSSMKSRTDGWDGWIELSGTNHVSPNSSGYYDSVNWSQGTSTQGVTVDPVRGKFSGYAWGGDVVGWIDFNPRMTAGTPGTIPGVSCPTCYGRTVLTGNCAITQTLPVKVGDTITLPVKVGDTITLTATPTSGSSPYTYTWYTGIGYYSTVYPTNYYSYSYPSAYTYYPYVGVTDKNGNSGSFTCGTVIVSSATPDVALWFNGDNPPASKSDVPIKTVRVGDDVVVRYEYDKNSLSCYGVFTLQVPTGYNLDSDVAKNWGDSNIIDNNSTFTFSNLVKGSYYMMLRCSSNSGISRSQSSWLANIISSISSIFAQAPVTIDSNKIKITVTKTSIEEI